MTDEQKVEVVRRLVESVNLGEPQAALDLLDEECVMVMTPEWPIQGPTRGKAAFRAALEDWRGPWQVMQLDLVEAYERDGRVVGHGQWSARGELSGVDSELDFGILLDIENGLIKRLEFFTEPELARLASER
jgi:ketosteroid isomerase-like protein